MAAPNTQPFHGWLNVLKPPDMTSHDVVDFVRRLVGRRPSTKVGHIGTLDPGASGVLPLCLGKATRLSRFAGKNHKTYVCEIVLGIETDTLDAEGAIVGQSDAAPSLADLEQILPRFTGRIEQRPPKFSAVHYQGKRAYRLAQRKEDFDLPARQVDIHELRLLDYRSGPPVTALLEVSCSGGTYIRSLCADIGKALGCGAHVGLLIRKEVHPFRLEDTHTLEELQADFASALLPIDWPLGHLPEIRLNTEQAARFCQGSTVAEIPSAEQEFFRVYGEEMIGIGKKAGLSLAPEIVLCG
ncbi:MAG: tRNA pseudouridine(55) synthase TruB [Armatimonadetes bacterium]|nr:tRNA pseudouridine(55) synthase TruB [Armatimonadota bacterium]NIM24641.1 tRNA pseudouridine(55) synthase TruB [Armatimonadota bacterium]NIM68520.1 tRNA pseudouridine(55) synthase TruB [Armatimonadota bacterium]NIM76902.1 tRNA pseudouridine(55) synthase TruB [Armatimonadota bacterium]NIN06714.1 tRNA pseudouridine(55) synthase TruB [Armatimonadota bacterium]